MNSGIDLQPNMRFEINRRKLVELGKFRGWISDTSYNGLRNDIPRGLITSLAHEMMLTVSYVRKVVLGHQELTNRFMLRYIKVSGVNIREPKQWADLFICIDGIEPEPHSPKVNLDKMRGHGFKYRRYSPSYQMRKLDNPDIEEETIEETFRVPGRSKHA